MTMLLKYDNNMDCNKQDTLFVYIDGCDLEQSIK